MTHPLVMSRFPVQVRVAVPIKTRSYDNHTSSKKVMSAISRKTLMLRMLIKLLSLFGRGLP